MLPLISFWTGAKAAEPNRSTWPIHSPEREESLGAFTQENRNTDAPNNPKRPSDASRNAKVSTPASVMGTSAKDLVADQYESHKGARMEAPG